MSGDALMVSELFRALGYVDGIQPAVGDKTEWHAAHLGQLRRLVKEKESQAASPLSSLPPAFPP
ncbi:hypothetical protein [Deinococcus aerolatus]|uniref:hypothetical protein n=1 Tax=Deinococcus aerolatus TaxID=522487 RepID=UPI001666681E|nr:hypothetical protein [Deinococcus aerolatus]